MRKIILDLNGTEFNFDDDSNSAIIIHPTTKDSSGKEYQISDVESEIKKQQSIKNDLQTKHLKCHCDPIDFLLHSSMQYHQIIGHNFLNQYTLCDEKLLQFLEILMSKLYKNGFFVFRVLNFQTCCAHVLCNEIQNSWTFNKLRKCTKSIVYSSKSFWTKNLATMYFQEYVDCHVDVIERDDITYYGMPYLEIKGCKNE